MKAWFAVVVVLLLPRFAQSQAAPPSFNGAFYAGYSYRADLSGDVTGRAMGGFEGAFGRGKIQPAVAVFFGGPEPNSIDLGFKSPLSSGNAGHAFWGAGAAFYSTVELRAFGRFGYDVTERRDVALRAEVRVYGAPIEPGFFAAVVLPAARR